MSEENYAANPEALAAYRAGLSARDTMSARVKKQREDARKARAFIRSETAPVELDLNTLIKAIERIVPRIDGVKASAMEAYATHIVQSYCECDIGYEGWEFCNHARDEGLA